MLLYQALWWAQYIIVMMQQSTLLTQWNTVIAQRSIAMSQGNAAFYHGPWWCCSDVTIQYYDYTVGWLCRSRAFTVMSQWGILMEQWNILMSRAVLWSQKWSIVISQCSAESEQLSTVVSKSSILRTQFSTGIEQSSILMFHNKAPWQSAVELCNVRTEHSDGAIERGDATAPALMAESCTVTSKFSPVPVQWSIVLLW